MPPNKTRDENAIKFYSLFLSYELNILLLLYPNERNFIIAKLFYSSLSLWLIKNSPKLTLVLSAIPSIKLPFDPTQIYNEKMRTIHLSSSTDPINPILTDTLIHKIAKKMHDLTQAISKPIYDIINQHFTVQIQVSNDQINAEYAKMHSPHITDVSQKEYKLFIHYILTISRIQKLKSNIK